MVEASENQKSILTIPTCLGLKNNLPPALAKAEIPFKSLSRSGRICGRKVVRKMNNAKEVLSLVVELAKILGELGFFLSGIAKIIKATKNSK